MLVIDTQTKALANMAARDFTKKFPHVILSRKWVKRRSFLFVISDVITLKAPSVCTPALTNKQHQNCHFDILIFGVLACELHHCFANFHIAGYSYTIVRELSSTS